MKLKLCIFLQLFLVPLPAYGMWNWIRTTTVNSYNALPSISSMKQGLAEVANGVKGYSSFALQDIGNGVKYTYNDTRYAAGVVAQSASDAWQAMPTKAAIKDGITTAAVGTRDVAANVAHGSMMVAGSGVRGFAAGVTPAAVQNAAAAAGNAVVNAVTAAPVQQALGRAGNETVAIINQPGRQGGIIGLTRTIAGEGSGAIANKIVEEGINPGATAIGNKIQQLQPVLTTFKDDLKNAALIAGGILAAGIITYWAAKIISNKIERNLNRPKLDFTLERADKAINPEEHHALFKEMVFDKEVKERLNTVLLATESIKQKIQEGDQDARYRNLLLYGPAGSGKRTFAHQLAKYANMDFYAITSSALMRFKDGDAATALEDFMKREAFSSSKGAVIYLENASMLFTKRRANDTNSLTRLVTAFMEQTERRSNKCMIVFGCSLKPNMGADIVSVIDDTIEIKRPSLEERLRILSIGRDKYFSTHDVSPELAHSVQTQLHDDKMKNIAAKLDNVSAADIGKFMETVKVEAQLPSEGTITETLLNRILDRTVQKYQELLAN